MHAANYRELGNVKGEVSDICADFYRVQGK